MHLPDPLRALQIPFPFAELRQVSVPCRRDLAKAQEQIHLHLLVAGEGIVHPVAVRRVLSPTSVRMLFAICTVNREQIHVPVPCLREPGEMVHAHRIDLDLMPLHRRDAKLLPHYLPQELLGAEHLMAAAEGLYLREDMVQRLHAECHWVGIIDDPGIRTAAPDALRDDLVHGDGAHGPKYPSRAAGVAHGLIDAVLLRRMDIGLHLVEGAGQDGQDDEVRPGQSLLQRLYRFVMPCGPGPFGGIESVADDFIVLRRLYVDVIQIDSSADVLTGHQVAHQAPGPAPGTTAHVGDFDVLCFAAIVPHVFLFLLIRTASIWPQAYSVTPCLRIAIS